MTAPKALDYVSILGAIPTGGNWEERQDCEERLLGAPTGLGKRVERRVTGIIDQPGIAAGGRSRLLRRQRVHRLTNPSAIAYFVSSAVE